jgi:alpha-mannosidase
MRMSLLRAPVSPDPTCDRGRHSFAFALMPHAGGWREAGVIAEAFAFNMPLRAVANAPAQSFASTDDSNIVIDTIKKAEDGDGVVVRLYECHGARGTARVKVPTRFKHATFCNALEEDVGRAKLEGGGGGGGSVEVTYAPHQIISIKLT